jgi:threonine aldolase
MARVDLRSDTVTRPTPAMRRAMADAEVGDAEYDDDPTVRALQDRAAEVTGKEAAIYLVTGTMCNQVALHVLTQPGSFVVAAADAHISGSEVATSALLSGVAYRQIATADGILGPDEVREGLEPDADRGPVVDLVAVENTYSAGGGVPWPLEALRAVRGVTAEAGVALHMDGSRIFNASAATGVPVSSYAAETDAVMFCLSKGLGAPIGSMLCGTAAFVEEARATKILFGISWRQAGITAAAGLVALDESPPLLPQDHANARLLAESICERTPGAVDLERVRTNIVFADPSVLGLRSAEAARRLEAAGVLVNVAGSRVRFVTHRDVTAADMAVAAEAWRAMADG